MIGNTVAAIFTLFLMSFAFKDNPFYRFAEYTFVGIATSYGFILTYERIDPVILTPLSQGRYEIIIPVILGLMLYSRFFKNTGWLLNYPISIFVGVGVGLSLRGIVSTQVIKQVHDTYTGVGSIGEIIILIGVICVLLFFFFSRKKDKETPIILKATSKVGRVFMMIAFGSLFGDTVLGRMTLLIGRIKFLLGDWLHIIG